MTERERLLAVYRGETPDRVPFFLDLSHWFYEKFKVPFDLSVAVTEPEWDLIAYHKKVRAGFYIPNRIACHSVSYPEDVQTSARVDETSAGPEITWAIETPIGRIQRKRLWRDDSYSWNVSEWGISTEQDLRVLGYALSRAQFQPEFDRYHAWTEALGDLGLLYMPMGYSAMGQLLNYWMGIEKTMFATADMPEVLEEVVEQINTRLLDLIDLLCSGPAEVIVLGDNFSSDVQSPRFFRKWSAKYYTEAFRRIRAAGKFSAVHVDGRMRGLLKVFAGIGCDAIDAVTPAPMGDMTPEECRDEAGPNLILSGGVSPSVWVEDASDDDFRKAVTQWLEIRKRSPRLIAAAGDQVPPKAPEHRIEIMRELVERDGGY